MTLQSKLEAALAILREHNEAIGEGNPGYVDVDEFAKTLKAIGATTEERLKGLSYEDILECFPPTMPIKPRLLAKEIAKVFRGKDEVSSEKSHVGNKKADRMSVQELVSAFDPENSTNAVGNALAKIAKGQAFIVYSSGRIVDVDSTVKLLQELKQGYPSRTDYTTPDGNIHPVYKIGEVPENYAEENPLYEDRPLRPDGTCDQTGRSWEGISLEVRQLVKIAVEIGELDVSIQNAHATLDLALVANAMKNLRARYRKASLKFDELSKVGNLPTLKIALNSSADTVKGNKRPFDNGCKVAWAVSPDKTSYRAYSQHPFANWDDNNKWAK